MIAIHTVKNIVLPSRPRIGIAGYFDVSLIHARTGLVKRRLRFRNVITNAGLDHIGNGSSLPNVFSYLAVGTGTAQPDEADTGLVSEIARTNSDGGFEDTWGNDSPVWSYYSREINRVFTEAEANGNLTELGFYTDASGGQISNRQLFLDENGSPTVITKTPDDLLHVKFEYRLYPPLVDEEQVVDINGVATTLTHGAINRHDGHAWASGGTVRGLFARLGIWSTNPSTAAGAMESNEFPASRTSNFYPITTAATAYTRHDYVAGTFHRECEAVWSPSAANFDTGIGALFLSPDGNSANRRPFMTTFAPKVAKDDTKRFVYQIQYSWGRAP